MALGGTIRMNVRKDQAKVEFHRPKRQPIVLRCPGTSKGEKTYSSSMNLDSPLAGILTSTHSKGLRIQQLCQIGGSNEGLFRLCMAQLASVDNGNS